MRQLRYAIDADTDCIVSYNPDTREYATEVIGFAEATYEHGFEMDTHLEKFPDDAYRYCSNTLIWTKKIPLEVKNWHRRFWGLKPVKASKWSPASVPAPAYTTQSMFAEGETDAAV